MAIFEVYGYRFGIEPVRLGSSTSSMRKKEARLSLDCPGMADQMVEAGL